MRAERVIRWRSGKQVMSWRLRQWRRNSTAGGKSVTAPAFAQILAGMAMLHILAVPFRAKLEWKHGLDIMDRSIQASRLPKAGPFHPVARLLAAAGRRKT